MFHAEEYCKQYSSLFDIHWAVNPDCLRFHRHHRHLTSTTACWLISRSIIIDHLHPRTCLPQTDCTPVVSLGSLDAIFFTSESVRKSARLSRHSPNIDASISSWLIARAGCRSVIAPRLRLLKWLTYLDCWIWLAKHILILCCSRSRYKSILSGICQSAYPQADMHPHAVYGHLAGTMFPLFLRGFQKRPTI